MSKLCVEDVIVKRKYQFGFVLTTYETYDSSDDDSDHERVNAGQVRVAWFPVGFREVVEDTKVILYDRSLIPGDVVYSLNKGGSTQCGLVRSVDLHCHARIFKTKQMVYDINSRDLHPILEFEHGDHVVMGFWLGTIREVSSELIIKLQNGARYVLTDEGASGLIDVHGNSEEFSTFNSEDRYYPGQVLGISSVFKKARWLSGTKPIMGSKTDFRGTVEKVKVISVEVHWEKRGLCLNESLNEDEIFKPPEKKIEGEKLKELKILAHFKPARMEIGNKAMFTVKNEQTIHPQHVTLGSLHCFRQPEPKHAAKKSSKDEAAQEEDMPMDVSPECGAPQEEVSAKENLSEGDQPDEKNSPAKVDNKGSIVDEAKDKVESVGNVAEMKVEDDMKKFNLETYEETLGCDDKKGELQDDEECEMLSGDSEVEDTDEGKSSEAGATSEPSKSDSKVGNVDLGLLRDIQKQLLEASDDIAKIGGSFNPLIGKMERHILKLLQSRNELHEQIALIDELIKDNDQFLVDLKEKVESDKPSVEVSSKKSGTGRVKSKSGRHKKQPVTAGEEMCVEVTHTSTVVDVTWQDGTTENGIRSLQLGKMNHMECELEFFPGDFVSQSENTEEGVYGLITSANHQDRTCTVRWYKRPMNPNESLIPQYTHTAKASVYDLVSHTDFTFYTGDIVVRVGDTQQDGLERPLPCAGQVLWMNTDGTIEIMWVDSMQSSALPQDLYNLPVDDENASVDPIEEGASAVEDQLITNNTSTNQQIEENISKTSPDINEKTEENIQPPSVESKDDEKTSLTESNKTTSVDEVNCDIPVAEGELAQIGKASSRQCITDEFSKSSIAVGDTDDSQSSKSNFIYLDAAPSEHVFADCTKPPNTPKKFISTVKKEDLFSVLIEGPKNTPYEDALFYFDVRLPSDYPGVPPLLYYHSYCSRRLNPNLIEGGKVCISLLGTWTGKNNEMWNSKSSTLLQVLVSIQGLILVAEPYYNEAGFEKFRGSSLGEEYSQKYNEMTLLKVVQSMTKMLVIPPPVFNDEVIDFCRKHSQTLINRIENWLETSTSTNTNSKSGSSTSLPSTSKLGSEPSLPSATSPSFPLLPFSKGFLLSIRQALNAFKSASQKL